MADEKFGKVIRIIGPVVDVEFESHIQHLPLKN